jgi:pimeloyl-ACP methyl ester carboxylesterase/UDP:flavonoid glycosyltransferase YjiC (YdhE family)
MRARLPDESGYVVNDGVRIYYEVHGTGDPTILLLPTWAIIDSRHWKMQVPFLARQYRVITFDPRGNGKSDRPDDPAAYSDDSYVSDARAVMEATGTRRAVVAGFSAGCFWSLQLARSDPQRVLGLVLIGPFLPFTGLPQPEWTQHSFDDELDTDEGWAKSNRHYWRRDWRGYVEFFMSQVATEAHSTKVRDDLVEWALQTDADTMLCEAVADAERGPQDEEEAVSLCRSLSCPVLVVTGDQDRITPTEYAHRIAELAGGDLLVVAGAGHAPHARFPVAVNHAIRDFVDHVVPRPRKAAWQASHGRPRRALWISSPIGLGHVQRDLAIARAVRERVPDLQIHWWAQPPVTQVLAEAGEIIHPASADMASESAHWESEALDHDLPAFYAFRRMDEIFCANYMLFDDVVRDMPFDLWVGDECWEIDYFLHENPDRKIAPYMFMTDVIGFLPADPEAGPREAELCADYNADAIEKRERFPRLRDVSMFIGSFEELPDVPFGPSLPRIRPWSRRWFCSVPYVIPFNPAAYRDRASLRRRLGYPQDRPLLVTAVGGTAVGTGLLELTCDAFSRLRKDLPDARMTLVTGPRIDPRQLPDQAGIDKRGYVPDLYEHLACADAAVVQGGLSTTMELVATGRPFIYFPLRRHWEQQHFVTHRLDHYRAGLRMDYATTSPDDLATAMQTALAHNGTDPGYRRVPHGGADRAAERITALMAAR